MKRLAHAKRRDLNEPEIVNALRRIGATVVLLDKPLDLLVGWCGSTWLLEVKRGELAPAARPLTEAEADFLVTWRGGAAKVVRCIEEALCVVGMMPCPQKAGNRETGFCQCGGYNDPPWLDAWRTSKRARR